VEKEVLRKFLKQKGLRFTKERETILDEILSRKGHFDLEEVYLGLRDKGSKVSRASIYRTVPLLLESGLLEEVQRTAKHAHYELTYGSSHHDHMLCTECGKVIEFYSPSIEKLQEKLCRARGFKGTSHTLEIMGTCRECRAKRKPRRRKV
jgi:Fur family ferric uptake transcriptional regulator